MQIFSIFNRHSWYAANSDAFADGELTREASTRFEAHLATCDSCQANVTEARQLQAVIARLPEVPVPRSFRLTPAMVAASSSAATSVRVPAALILVRAGAALSVAAFASILAFGALNSNESDSTTGRQAGADFSANDAAGAPASESLSDKAAATAEVPRLASPAVGGASGSSLATPTAMTSSALAPATGGAPASESPAPSPVGNAHDVGGATSSVGLGLDGATPAAAQASDNGPSALAIAFGVLASAMVGLLAAVEVTRRIRNKRA